VHQVGHCLTLYRDARSTKHKIGLIPSGELIVTYCENDAEHLNTICDQNVELQYITAWAIYVIIMEFSSMNVMISVAELY